MSAYVPTPSGRAAEPAGPAASDGEAVREARFSLPKLLPLIPLIAGFAAIFALGLDEHLSFSALREHRGELLDFVAQSGVVAALVYAALYIGATALSLPWGSLLTIAGGFLFGPYLGGLLTVVAATVGATIVFVIAKSALGDPLRARAHKTLKSSALRRLEAGFQANALSYMLFLRLAPIFPFFIVNLAPAFLGVPLRVYIVGTFIGIIPGTFIYALVGSGLGSVFDRNEDFSVEGVLTPEVVAALAGMALLTMIPVAVKAIRRRKS